MRAFILAGGLGTRLSSIVNDRPKPLAMVGHKPFLEHQIELLKRYKIADFVLCVGYRHEQIEEYFCAGERWNVKIQYSVEGRPLGTAGAVKNADRFIRETFLLLNGDTYIDINIDDLVQFHQHRRSQNDCCIGTLALSNVADGRSFGAVQVDAEGQILTFDEKRADCSGKCHANAGVYVFEPDILDWIPTEEKTSLECETLPQVMSRGRKLFGYLVDGFFVDIGTPQNFFTFQNYLEGAPHADTL